jgi:hypothetical protein
MKLQLTEPQDDFVFSESQFPAIIGGLGSGKTRGGTIRAVIKLIRNKGCSIAYYLPTYDLLRLRAIPGVEDDLRSIGLEFTTNRSEYTIKVEGYGSIIFRSYDRPERIVAYEVAHSIVDELDTLPKEKAAFVWRKVSERNRQKCDEPNTIGCVTTPDNGVNGFVYEKWVKKQQSGYELIKAPTASNLFLPDGYIQQIRDNYDPVLADLYINGEFVSLTQNKVYHFYKRTEMHTDRKIEPSDTYLHIGIDFNIGGCCAVVALIEAGLPIITDEFVSHDTYDFVNNLAARYGDNHKIIIYPDASGASRSTNATQSDVSIIENAGYYCDFGNTNPAVRDRINSINALLSHDKLRINSDTCPNLAHSLETQGYDKKGSPEKYTDHPAIDDWNDCCGYLIYGKWAVNKSRPASANGYY